MQLPHDFKEFLKLLNAKNVEYLVVGGYAVSFYGFPRPTGDIDIWIAVSPHNATLMVEVMKEFGFNTPNLSADLFLDTNNMVRMGVPPVKIEILNEISGVDFADCHSRRVVALVDSVEVPFISEADLKINKAASGRLKDLNDLENLP